MTKAMAGTGDYMVRASSRDGSLRAFAARTTETVDQARRIHSTSPCATAALGRLLTASLLMGMDMKNESDLITLRVSGDGPVGGLLVTADSLGHAKGYAVHPDVDILINDQGKLDVASTVGSGILSVVRDTGMKEPYVGETELISGEIAEDISYYFAVSEQIPSVVALGVLVDTDYRVLEAGGYIIQLMPGAGEEIIELIERDISGIDSVTSMLSRGMEPEDILREVLKGFELDMSGRMDCGYYCGCDRKRVERALLSIGRKDLTDIIEDGEDIELSCQFCGRKYSFSPAYIRQILSQVSE